MKRLVPVLVLLLALGGGYWLSRRSAVPGGPVDLVPGDARIYLQLLALPGPVARASAIVRTLGFGSMLEGGLRGVSRQLGFDPFDAKALRESGIDPTRPLGAFQPADGEGLVVLLPLQESASFARTFERLWSDRTGGTVEEGKLERHPVWRALDPSGALKAAWAPIANHAVIATGAGSEARLLSVLEPGGAPGLARSPPFSEAYQALVSGTDLFVWALTKDVARADRRLAMLEQGLKSGALAITFAPTGIRLAAFGDLDAVAATALPVFLPPDARRSASLLAGLAPEAVLAGRLSLSLAELWRRLRSLPRARALEGLEAQARARGLEIEDLLQLFAGHFVFGLWPAPEVDLSRVPAFDLRRTNPFVYLHTEVWVALTDPARARAALPELAEALAPALRADISRAEIEGSEVFTIRYHLGEGMSFGIVGDALLITGGDQVFAAALSRAKQGSPGFGATLGKAPLAAALRGEGSGAALLQVGRLLLALGAVDSERLGGGPGGMAAALAFRKLRKTLAKIDHLAAVFVPHASAVEARLAIELVSEVTPRAGHKASTKASSSP